MSRFQVQSDIKCHFKLIMGKPLDQSFYEIDNATTLAWKNAQVTPIPPKM